MPCTRPPTAPCAVGAPAPQPRSGMATGSLLALLDDITTILDDVALLTKVAAKKTSGVLGDDLALNAEQVAGVRAKRELPVVFAVARGSLVNKAILVPAALAISAFAPWLVTPLLMVGGAFLCFEGTEKLAHKLFHAAEDAAADRQALISAVANPEVDLVALERDKIRGAVRTDFVLSAEIVTIALGTVAEAPFTTQVVVLSGLALLMTAGVYGLVACIVKLDDLGLYLMHTRAAANQKIGRVLLGFAPYLMKGLTIAGTVAMFLVGGGILVHGTPGAHDWLHHQTEALASAAGVSALQDVLSAVANGLYGLAAGAVLVLLFTAFQRLRARA
jgi:uncharacterized protein